MKFDFIALYRRQVKENIKTIKEKIKDPKRVNLYKITNFACYEQDVLFYSNDWPMTPIIGNYLPYYLKTNTEELYIYIVASWCYHIDRKLDLGKWRDDEQ